LLLPSAQPSASAAQLHTFENFVLGNYQSTGDY
jgi:hypothetical protein